jgi:hypothetical protein
MVVGCGRDTKNNRVFFTLNGKKLPSIPVANLDAMVYPAVAFDDADDSIKTLRLNFGDDLFMYDADEDFEQDACLMHSPQRSWLVKFEENDPLELTRTRNSPSAGSIVLTQPVHALRPLPGTQILYYELTIVEAEDAGVNMCMGFGSADMDTGNSLPGLQPRSAAWHGDDGKLYYQRSVAHKSRYGPCWHQDDVIGVGLDLATHTLFFTHNGTRLKTVTVFDAADLQFAVVGFSADAEIERVKLNFGDAPFKYAHPAAYVVASESVAGPYARAHPQCSWNVLFESPLELRRLYAFDPESEPESEEQFKEQIGTVRLSAPEYALRPLPGTDILYFELTVLDLGAKGTLAVGFCASNYPLDMAPGHTKTSVGFHGDDAMCGVDGEPIEPAEGELYGQLWKEGDVIGAALSRADGSCFFTQNGKKLADVPLKDIAQFASAACVAFNPGATTERCRLNLGDAPFKYVHNK